MVSNIYGQEVTLTGTIRNEREQHVHYATISLTNSSDTSKVYGMLADEDGKFSIKVPKAHYTLEISVVGVNPYQQKLNLIKTDNVVNLGSITIQTNIALEEVVITSDHSQRIALDKKVYAVTKDILAGGGNLVDVMQNIPSVQVEVDGNISIRGNGNVLILVDGTNSGLTNTQTFLKTIPAGSIEKVEVITNPSAKYNAEGTGGIINVVLKKGKKKLLSSSFEIFSGIPLNSGANVNLSQGGEKISWYLNSGIGYSEPKKTNELALENRNTPPETTFQNSEKVLKQFYFSNNFGGQLALNKKHKISVDLTYRVAELRNENSINYLDFSTDILLGQSVRIDTENHQNKLLQLSSKYEWKALKDGASFELGFFAQNANDDSNSIIEDIEILPIQEAINKDFSTNIIRDHRYSFWAEYLLPFKNNEQLEFGTKHRTTIIKNDFEVTRLFDSNFITITEFTDNTTYDENILAFFLQYARSFKHFKYQIGLRSETTNIDLLTENNTNERPISYTNLFPSAFMQYDLNKDHQLRLSASRRIRRPRLNALVSFSSFSDSRNVFVGNPSINPSLVLRSELSYQGKLSNRISVFPTLFYSHTTDVMDYFIQKENITINRIAEEIFVTKTVNIGQRDSYGIELGTSFKVFNWLRFFSEFMISRFVQTGSFNTTYYDSTGVLSSGRLRFNFSPSKSLRIQMQHRFRGGNQRGQFTREPVYRMDMGMSKQLFDDKATLSVNFKDVFNTWKFRLKTNAENFTQNIVSQVRTPQANISFIYLLNQKKYKGKKGQQYDKLN